MNAYVLLLVHLAFVPSTCFSNVIFSFSQFFNLLISRSHSASFILYPRQFYNHCHLPVFVDQPPSDTTNMISNQRNIKIPKSLSLNSIASQESSCSATNAMLDGIGYPPTVTSVQNRAVRARRTPIHARLNMSPALRLPPPSPGYTGYPRPQRVFPEELLASAVGRNPLRAIYSGPPRPKLPPSPRVVDGCELARQERENVMKIKARLPSEEVRNREWQNGKAIRMEEKNQALSAFRSRKRGGQP